MNLEKQGFLKNIFECGINSKTAYAAKAKSEVYIFRKTVSQSQCNGGAFHAFSKPVKKFLTIMNE
jgi:hypothetical protein